MAKLVVTGTDDDPPALGGLLEGKKFFVLRRCPSANTYQSRIQANGGRIVRLENQADYIIADHLRRDAPPGSTSYKFIDECIKIGELLDHNDFPAGPAPGTVREVGSTVPGKSTRTAYTKEDDLVLWRWVESQRASGMSEKGLLMYKLLEAQNSRHTSQSWRDRYLKQLKNKPPTGASVMVPVNAPPSPPQVQHEENNSTPTPEQQQDEARPQKKRRIDDEDDRSPPNRFTKGDWRALYKQAGDIENIAASQHEGAWNAWAEARGRHTSRQWQDFYATEVRPIYLKRQKERGADGHAESGSSKSYSSDDEEISVVGEVANDPQSNAAAQSVNKDENQSRSDEFADQNNPHSHRDGISTPHSSTNARRKLASHSHTLTEDAPISEINTAAELQVHREVLRHKIIETSPSSEDVPTSERNRGADLQMQKEYMNSRRQESHSNDIEEHREEEIASPVERLLPTDSRLHKLGPGQPLTEANLASQQAQNQMPLLRATDLPVDEENQDQSEFLDYLKTTLGQKSSARVINLGGANSDSEDEVDSDDGDLPTDPLQGFERSQRTGNATLNIPGVLPNQMPLSKSHEIEDAISGNLGWPFDDSQNLEMQGKRGVLRNEAEKQIVYPNLTTLTPDKDTILANETRNSLSSQSVISQLNDEFSLHGVDHNQDIKSPTRSGKQIASTIALAERHPAADGRTLPIHDYYSDELEDDIDFAVPEPEGGFLFKPPSPAQSPIARPSPPISPLFFDDNDDEDEDNEFLAPDTNPVHLPLLGNENRISASSSSAKEIVAISSASSLSSDELLELRNTHYTRQQERLDALETQDIFDAETQLPDFGMPLPPDLEEEQEHDAESEGLQDRMRSRSNSWPAGDAQDVQNAVDQEDLGEWISAQKSRGFDELAIIKALRHASMQPNLAKLILLEERCGKGFPRDVAGIWSDHEDHALDGGDARAIRMLEEKHGWSEIERRMKYLSDVRELME